MKGNDLQGKLVINRKERENMKIEVSTDQYKKLLKAFYLGDLVLHSMKEEEDETDDTYVTTEQYFLSLAKQFDCEEYVQYDEELNQYFPTPAMEHEFDPAMRKYEEEILPDQIAALMARNDVDSRIRANQLKQEDAVEVLFELEDRYLDHFEREGFTGLSIKK